ncbi:dephospho-CoA kinase [Oscillatoria salina]|uniref:dephospho-CoA kinase n=1 Tax=Oscillatoria salina TaxID=331517 RepID=UPI001CCC3EC9|nr:dephospho-CoA kinase [Oscillatoria salina]
MKMQRIIGLTGGIATGKTTVSNYLANNYNFPVFDADIYAREAVQSDSFILTELAQRYSPNILLSNGELDRQALAKIIFHNPQERSWVEQKIHPYVRQRIQAQLRTFSGYIAVLAIPLLFEAKMTDLCNEIWVVSCHLQQQIKRLIERNNFTLAQAQARIDSQMPLGEKIAAADVVLDNSATLDYLYKQIDAQLISRQL